MKRLRLLAFVVTLTAVAGTASRAAGLYSLQRIARLGDRVGESNLRLEHGFWVGALNDNRQIVFVTGGVGVPELVQYADGKFTLLVSPGQNGPSGKWPQIGVVWSPVSMNGRGDVVFSVLDQFGTTGSGTFLWDNSTRQVSTVAVPRMPTDRDQVLLGGGGPTPTLNNRGEIALVASLRVAAGEGETGVFRRASDGPLTPVALPDQTLPDGQVIQAAFGPSLNEAGAIAFLASRRGNASASAYLWEKGEIVPIAVVGTEVAPKSKLAAVWSVHVNNKDRSVLVEASLKSTTSPHGLYRWTEGKLTTVAVPGQVLPDGETLERVAGGVSAANGAGQHVFLATLASHATAAYLLEPDGRLSSVLKSSLTVEPGAITRVGEPSSFGVGLNNRGEVALPVRLGGITGSVLVLLSPQ
jgi:hypothetical protein